MKALTLHAPWAWAICYLGKNVENRTWMPPADIIGQRIAIHAGSALQWDAMYRKFRWAPVFVCANRAPVVKGGPTKVYGTFKTGEHNQRAERDRFCSAIVATAILERVKPPQDTDDGWHITGYFGWVLADVRVLPTPVKCKGALKFWTVPADIEQAIKGAES